MTKRELLSNYRETLLELHDLEVQLARTGTDGRPAACRSQSLGSLPSTNDTAAAMRQLADGLETMAQRKRNELAQMGSAVSALLAGIRDGRTFTVVQHYYLMAETDEAIARQLSLSTSRVNQLRRKYLSAA